MKYHIIWLSSVALFSMLSLTTMAETVEVVASGTGITPDNATRGALRSAVEQVVGQLVDATTLVANEDIVSDKILTYSGGYVEGYEPIKQPTQGADGLYTTKIKALVKKTELVEKLRAENVTKSEVSGTALFAQMTTKQRQAEDAGAILSEEFKDFPTKLLTALVAKKPDGAPDLTIDESTSEVGANIVLRVDTAAYDSWVKRVLPKMDAIADFKHEATLGYIGVNGGSPCIQAALPKEFSSGEQNPELILGFEVERSPNCMSAVWRLYRVTGDKAKTISKMIDESMNRQISIDVRLSDGLGNFLGGNTITELVYFSTSIICERWAGGKTAFIGRSMVQNNRYSRDSFTAYIEKIAARLNMKLIDPCGVAMQGSVKLGKFTPEQIKAAASIKCAVSGR